MVIVINTLSIEQKLSEKYKYKPLEESLSIKYRKFFQENIPRFLHCEGGGNNLYSSSGTLLCSGYNRIVIGDYGAFIEFDETQANSSSYIIEHGQEYRVNDPKYSKNVKYVWLTLKDKSGIKIYHQKKHVSYADYNPDMYYVSPHEVCILY
jgi:hypothetical protein